MPKHLLSGFNTAERELRALVLKMAELTRHNLETALKGLFERDDDSCSRVIVNDEVVDQLEKQVDKDGVALLSRYQPQATDLRQAIAAMKVGNDLERIADQAVSIARKARLLRDSPVGAEVDLLHPLAEQALERFRESMQAFALQDASLALAQKAKDKTLDWLCGELTERLTRRMQEQPSHSRDFMNLLFIARHLERVGDHATNIAEDAVYVLAGADIRHGTKVLFVCNHNSARSQMAEMWMRQICGGRFQVKSAGLNPGQLHPLAVEVMREVGIDMSRNKTKSVFDLFRAGELFHYVISVCDESVGEECPIFAGITERLQWSFPDPSQAEGSLEQQLAIFRHVRDTIRAKVEQWCQSMCQTKAGLQVGRS